MGRRVPGDEVVEADAAALREARERRHGVALGAAEGRDGADAVERAGPRERPELARLRPPQALHAQRVVALDEDALAPEGEGDERRWREGGEGGEGRGAAAAGGGRATGEDGGAEREGGEKGEHGDGEDWARGRVCELRGSLPPWIGRTTR